MNAGRSRSRHSAARTVLLGLLAFAVILVIGSCVWVAEHGLVAVPVVLAALGGTYLLGRHHHARSITTAARPKVIQARPAAQTRAQRNGWEAPSHQKLLLISEECTGTEPHALCHDPRCQCPCGHPTRQSAARDRQPTAVLPDKPPF